MITSMISSMIRPMITTMVNPDSGGGAVFSPLTASYSSASFTAVVVTNTEIISFHVKGLTTSGSLQYFLGSSTTAANVFYRGSDGRFRLTTDAGLGRQLNYTGLNDGGDYFIEMRINPNGWDLYVDGLFKASAGGSVGNCTFDMLANDAASMTLGAVYGVTLGGSASWPMQSTSDDVFDGEDMIGSNDLTYNGAPGTITSADTVETSPL